MMTVELTLNKAKTALAGKPSLIELAARIAEREPCGKAVAPLVREDRDVH